MRWDDIDGEWWTIPAELSKNGLSHRVPLSAQALDVVNDLRTDVEVEPQKCAWVFAKRRGDGHATRGLVAKPLSSWTERAKLTDFRLHDLRRTAASHMTSMGISRLTVSKILNHVETGVTAVYDRHSYDAEKRQALNVWGARVTAIVSGALDDNVVDLAMQNRSAAS
jgi:integrase